MLDGKNAEVTIEKLVYGGDGLARVDGRVLLTRYVLPDERVVVATVGSSKDVVRARMVELRAASIERVTPGCLYFGRCGGCQYQHAGYEYQLDQKVSILREVLRRVGKLAAPEQIGVVAGPPWEYRNRSQFHVMGGRVGYLEAGSHRLCAVDHCPISSPAVNRALGALAGMARDSRFPRFLRSVEVFTNEDQTQINAVETLRPVGRRFFDWCAEKIPGASSPWLEYSAAGFVFRVSPHSFFQVNRFLIEKLVEACAAGEAAGDVLDLYAGVGLFALPLARAGARVTAVESGSSATRDLEWNAERAGLRVAVVKERVELFLAGLNSAPELVIADPPRAGLGKQVTAELLRLKPRRIIVVACDPATLARDLNALSARYRIREMTLVDLFPQTYHMETLVKLEES